MPKTTFTKAKKNRNELQLPILHFVAADDWIEKLGPEVFTVWLKFYSWCDRSDERKDPDNDVIPSSMSKIMKRLGIGRKKFYDKIIRPLWNYGLIDLVEYEESGQYGTKPVNIIVYEYPQNDIQKKYQPLEKIRDYDQDYDTEIRKIALMGGRKPNKDSGCFQMETGGCFPEETGGVSIRKQGGVSKWKHNNVSNSITNDSNSNINDSNHIINLSISDKVKSYLIKHKDRLGLRHDNHSAKQKLQAIEELDGLIDEDSYCSIILSVLENKRIKNFKKYLLASVQNYQKDKQEKAADPKHQPVRQESLPNWWESPDEYYQQGQAEKMDPAEFEAKKRALEERLKKRQAANG
jgi:hypothetical protein